MRALLIMAEKERWKLLLWWPTVFSALVGAPSILQTLQKDLSWYSLSYPFKWLTDGYQEIEAVVETLLLPLLLNGIGFIEKWTGLSFTLQASWKTHFIVFMLIFGAYTRWLVLGIEDVLQKEYPSLFARCFLRSVNYLLGFIYFGFSSLISTLSVALLPTSDAWWAQLSFSVIAITSFLLALKLLHFLKPVGRLALEEIVVSEPKEVLTIQQDENEAYKENSPLALLAMGGTIFACLIFIIVFGVGELTYLLVIWSIFSGYAIAQLCNDFDEQTVLAYLILGGPVLAICIILADFVMGVIS